MRVVAVYATPLAQHHDEASGKAQVREAEGWAEHGVQGQRRCCACEADAEAAIAEYAGRETGTRGRRIGPWRYHEVRYRVDAQWPRTQRPQRGRPQKGKRSNTSGGSVCVSTPRRTGGSLD
jgi:hypothetical protein